MLHAGLDLSRRRLDVCVEEGDGAVMAEIVASPDLDGLRHLVSDVERYGTEVSAVIESMTGARFVHDQLELMGWNVEIADAAKVKGIAPLACKTDRVDARVLAELSRRDLVPAIWLPPPGVRAARERSRWRLHLVRNRTRLKNRVHATLMSFGVPSPSSDLFGVGGRALLERLDVPEPWLGDTRAALRIVDHLAEEIAGCEDALRAEGADHPYVPLLRTIPGIDWILAYTIAAEIGDIARFPTAKKLCGYTGLCPRVYQSGPTEHYHSIAKNGPRYLRWALVEATTHASRSHHFRDRYQRIKARLGKQRGAKVARIDLARQLAVAIWHMCRRNEAFAPAGPAGPLAA